MSVAEELERLSALHAKGQLSDEEYRAAKGLLLEGPAPEVNAPASRQPTPVSQSRTDPVAVAALVLSSVGFLLIGIPLGIWSRARIRRSQGRLRGTRIAVAAIVVGLLWAVAAITVAAVLFFKSQEFETARDLVATLQENGVPCEDLSVGGLPDGDGTNVVCISGDKATGGDIATLFSAKVYDDESQAQAHVEKRSCIRVGDLSPPYSHLVYEDAWVVAAEDAALALEIQQVLGGTYTSLC